MIDMQTNKTTDFRDSGKDPAWSPREGRWIAYVREEGSGDSHVESVWIVEPSGKNPRLIAEGGAPSWSADGKTLYFHSRKEGKIFAAHPVETKADIAKVCDMPWSYFPAVSPDGTQVAFTDDNGLHVLATDTLKEVLAVPLPTKGGSFLSWSPDGKQIGVGSCYSQALSECGVCIVDLKTKECKRIASGRYTMPFWSPDGSKIVMDYRRDQNMEVWVIETKDL